jgi:MoxR-like ATPase
VRGLVDNIEMVIYGKREVIELCVVGLLARGHVLIEDIPGIGKTTLAQGLARSINCTFTRIQFTSDMLPSDILGVSILDTQKRDFEFREGPIFAHIVLADEVNRTPPKTQSALLEAMSEFHVSVDGRTRMLPKPFMVMATQNPVEYEGTYHLPEAQMDRFLLRVGIGYPNDVDELRIMRRHSPQHALDAMKPVLDAVEVERLQDIANEVRVEDSVARYMLDIVQATREHPDVRLGISPRGSLALYEATQAFALLSGRDYVTPGDVKRMAAPVLAHRLLVRPKDGSRSGSSEDRENVVDEILAGISIPE